MKKLSFKDMLGYSIAATGDYAAYGFIFAFLPFFLTTIVGISPSVAGLIVSLAVVWDAITDPIVGALMDRHESVHGSRRSFIRISFIPLGASIVLLFLNVDLPSTQQNIYYFILVLIFWTFYTIWNIPYYSLGSVITEDDDERTKISGIRQITGFIGTFFATSVPTFLVGVMIQNGIAESDSWLYVALVVALVVVITIGVMLYFTRGLEPIEEKVKNTRFSLKDFFSDISHVMKLRYYVIVICAALFTNIYMSLFNSSVIYYATFNLEVTEIQASILFTVQTIISILAVPFLTQAAIKLDKKTVYIVKSTILCKILYNVLPVTH